MALYHVFDEVENRRTGVPMAGVTVAAMFPGTDMVAPIFADANRTPFDPADQAVTDADGMYSFYIEQGFYDLTFSIGSRLIKRVSNVNPGLAGPPGPANNTYGVTLDLENAEVSNVSAILAEVGKAGTFTIRDYADFTTEVAADVDKVNYIRSLFDTSKVWVRTSILPQAGEQIGMGTTSGTILPDNGTAKQWMEALEGVSERAIVTPPGEIGTAIPASAARARRLFRWATDGSPTLVNAATVYVEDFGWVPDSVGAATGNSLAFTNACNFLSTTWGGGTLLIPPGISYHVGLVMGDGSDAAQSSKHHNIRIKGQGSASSNEVTNVGATGITVLKYAGTTSATAACLRLEGPIHDVRIEDLELDCDGKAGFGLDCIHVGSPLFENVVVRNWTDRSYRFTTRTGYPVGAAYGMGNGALYDCYAYSPASNSANGILMTSGVSTGTTLVGNPDTANLDIYGGVFFYGGSTGTSGLELHGCDNNSVNNSQLLPKGGNDGGGKSVKWTQWTGSPVFPLGNRLIGIGFSQAMAGAGGTLGNEVHMDTSDSGWTPNIQFVNFHCVDGKVFKNGQRTYVTYSIQTAELNNSAQNTTSTSFGDVSGLSLSLSYPAGSKLKLSYTGLATKSTTGDGDFILHFSGSDQGPTISRIAANGTYGPVCGQCLIDLPSAGTSVTAKLRFKSNDGNQVSILYASLIAEVLY